MWTRIMSYVAEFRCCREGEAEGGMWSVKRPIMMTYNNKPKDTLYSWGEDKLVYLGEIVDGWLDAECTSLFPGISHLELCRGSVVIDDVFLEQFKNGRRTRMYSIMGEMYL